MALNHLRKAQNFQKSLPPQKAGSSLSPKKSANLRMISKDHHRWLKKYFLSAYYCTPHSRRRLIFSSFSYTSVSRCDTRGNRSQERFTGTPFPLKLVWRITGGVINKAVITLNLPEGIAVPGFPAGRNLTMESAGDIASGNLVKKLLANRRRQFGRENIGLGILLDRTGTRFEVRSAGEVKIKGSAVSMEIKIPAKY